MSGKRPLTFAGVDSSYRDAFLEDCSGLVYLPYFVPVLDFCLNGGLESGRLVRITDIIPNSTSTAYKAYTGAGVRSAARAAERQRVDDFLLNATGASSAGTLVEMAYPNYWPDGGSDLFTTTASVPEGLSTVGLARCPPKRTTQTRFETLAGLVVRMLAAGHRAPLFSVDVDGALALALLSVAFNLPRRVEWIGRVSPQLNVTMLKLEVTQPGAADAFDVHDLLDNAVATPTGEAFAHASRGSRDFVVYRPHVGGLCYAHVCPRRSGATFAYLERYMRQAVAELESMQVGGASARLERFYAVRKAARGGGRADVEAAYDHAIQMLLLANHYPLFVARQTGGMSVKPLHDPPTPPAPPHMDVADSEEKS